MNYPTPRVFCSDHVVLMYICCINDILMYYIIRARTTDDLLREEWCHSENEGFEKKIHWNDRKIVNIWDSETVILVCFPQLDKYLPSSTGSPHHKTLAAAYFINSLYILTMFPMSPGSLQAHCVQLHCFY